MHLILDFHPLDYGIWSAMQEKYKAYTPLTINWRLLKTVLEEICKDLLVLDVAVVEEATGMQGGHCGNLLMQRSAQKNDPFQGQTNGPF